MNKILSVLLCVVFLQVEAMALVGGPDYGGNAPLNPNVFGNYAGVFIEAGEGQTITEEKDGFPSTADFGIPGGSIGVFSLEFTDDNALGTGTVVIFEGGRAFTGTFTGVADPGLFRIFGLIDAAYDFSVTRSSPVFDPTTGIQTGFEDITREISASVNGSLEATVSAPPRAPRVIPGATNQQAQSTTGRFFGSASTQVSFGQVNNDNKPIVDRAIEYVVFGTIVPETTTTATPTV